MRPPCFNRPPRAETYRMQSGWIEYGNVRVARMVDVPNVFEDRCASYDGRGIGPNGESYAVANGYDCTGCRWLPGGIK